MRREARKERGVKNLITAAILAIVTAQASAKGFGTHMPKMGAPHAAKAEH